MRLIKLNANQGEFKVDGSSQTNLIFFYEITSLDDKWISVKVIDLVIDFCKAHDLAPLFAILRRREERYNFDMAHNKLIKIHPKGCN